MDYGAVAGAFVVASSAFAGSLVALGVDATRQARRVNWALDRMRSNRALVLSRLHGREKGRGHAADVVRDMPTFLDIVNLGLSAGLSFDASVELYCERFQTSLASQLGDCLLLWRMGVRSRSDALRQMANRVRVPALERFVQTVEEALVFGTPLASTLQQQAQVIRDEQRAQVEERIERAPVQILLPLGTLIVPAMLLSILGPLLGPALGVA